jgi:hypothetical protein
MDFMVVQKFNFKEDFNKHFIHKNNAEKEKEKEKDINSINKNNEHYENKFSYWVDKNLNKISTKLGENTSITDITARNILPAKIASKTDLLRESKKIDKQNILNIYEKANDKSRATIVLKKRIVNVKLPSLKRTEANSSPPQLRQVRSNSNHRLEVSIDKPISFLKKKIIIRGNSVSNNLSINHHEKQNYTVFLYLI